MLADEIQQSILTFIQQSEQGATPDFNALALQVFAYQFEHNLPYRKYAQTMRQSPIFVKNWQQIPLMPIRGYKHLTLSTTPVVPDEPVFMSSGTTDPAHRSRNYHPSFQVWDASMKGPFKKYVLPDCDKMQILALFPGEKTNANSSLSRYVSRAIDFFGTKDSQILIDDQGLNYMGLIQALKQAEAQQQPVMLLGASFSYVHIFDYFKQYQLKFQLPVGSRLFDTGGFKGQSRTVAQTDLFTTMTDLLGIQRDHYLNMYGMTEISSQCYDQNLVTSHNFDKATPDWVRVRILDPDTLKPVATGQTGLIAYYDLANWNSCVGILTEDLGRQNTTGFELLGRVEGSEAKGCSIAVDQLLAANQSGR
ncbi:AMP-binding protein [Loigolactobacillus bifermentans]|uniref:Acyl-protein synthetase LuxE domain-containing protein n=1 Tax=Loigolactobacillus bifermentans DSM 20003 TaxID=1423726 RepID=A0A0R1H3B8_9LACO|nr:AMP-binding protein [Loigolactobacillus bifermentans]KRK41021.1 hypothetical protein FC07_GL001719 [Loigolactobacillus bifermentans DSM 20003]QGG59896.1 AMP-binding protein [Loigolactobacillus bifermentans]